MPISADVGNRGSLSAEEWQTITPSDTVDLFPRPRAIMVNVSGNLALLDNRGNSVILAAMSGILYSLRPSRILTTGTTATGITGFY